MLESLITRSLLFTILVLLAAGSIVQAQHKGDVEVWKIWDGAPHNAFTDLLYFKGNFYCSFREGSGHVPGTDGSVRILKSPDGRKWESAAAISKDGTDLRDPKLSITPEGKIMVIMGGSVYREGKLLGRKPQVSFSDTGGSNYSAPEEVRLDPQIASDGHWLWRVTWFKGVGYSIDYQVGPEERKGPAALYLLKTSDGKYFEKVSEIKVDGFPNESTIRFDKKGNMHVLIRRELGDKMGVLAQSSAPFTEWRFQSLNQRLGGPNFLFTDNGKILMGTRVHEGSIVYTGLFLGDSTGNFQKVATFPSSGDTSYPGMVIRKDSLWISYYSSHEGKTSIYMAALPLKSLLRK